MNTFKRITGLALAGAMTFSLFTGCSKTDEFRYSDYLTEEGFFKEVDPAEYVTLPEYKGIEITEDILTASDESIQEKIDEVANANAESLEITDRAVEDGDTVNIDYVGSVDGEEFEGGSTEGNADRVMTAGRRAVVVDYKFGLREKERPGEKACYVPVSHRSFVDNIVKEGQLSLDVVGSELNRLRNIPSIMHNGKFDINVIYWRFKWVFENLIADTMVGSKILNELEPAGLKYQYHKIFETSGKENDYSSLFDGINFAFVPINVAYLYGAGDAEKTYKLYQWQCEQYNLPGNEKLKELYETIEVPLVPVIAAMQREGVSLDLEKAEELSIKYHALLDECEKEVDNVCKMYSKEIAEWNRKHPTDAFVLPLNPASAKQVAHFLYKVLGITSTKGESTGEEVLKEIDEPICEVILKHRGIKKLLTTYIDKMPTVVNPVTGRIHASFNQNGTDTGRLSSNDPNLQNIPSHNEEIRTMFTAETSCVVNIENSQVELLSQDEVLTTEGWTTIDNIKLGVIIITDSKLKMEVVDLKKQGNKFVIKLEERK